MQFPYNPYPTDILLPMNAVCLLKFSMQLFSSPSPQNQPHESSCWQSVGPGPVVVKKKKLMFLQWSAPLRIEKHVLPYFPSSDIMDVLFLHLSPLLLKFTDWGSQFCCCSSYFVVQEYSNLLVLTTTTRAKTTKMILHFCFLFFWFRFHIWENKWEIWL